MVLRWFVGPSLCSIGTLATIWTLSQCCQGASYFPSTNLPAMLSSTCSCLSLDIESTALWRCVCVCCVSSALATRNLGTYVSLLDLESFVGHDWTPGSSQGAEECCRSLLMLSRAAPCIFALRSDCIAHLTLVQQEPGLYFVLGIDACCLLDFATLWTWLMAAHVAVHLGIGPLLALSLARAFPWRYAHPALAIPLWYGSTCCMMALAPCARGRFMLWTKNN